MDYFESWGPQYDEDGEIVPVTLFTVKARYDPSDEDISDLPTIARIELTSALTKSTFGDERLFFQHETMHRDLKKL